MRLQVLFLTGWWLAGAEVHTLTLRQAIDRALHQNPDILIARLEAQKASVAVGEARDPFLPKLFAGSGLAYTSGFPMSIEGSAPSVIQTRAVQTFYNRPLSFQVAAARENARGAAIDAEAKRDEIVHRVSVMFLAAERAARVGELVKQQLPSLEAIANSVRVRVEEGRELPVESRAADLRVAQARQRIRALETERDYAESSLAAALGWPPEDRVVAAREERRLPSGPADEAAAVTEALSNSKQVKQLESALQAKQLQSLGARSSRYPQVDLVAQYALMGKFNNYEDFFRKFERHNWQFGISLQLPILRSEASESQAAQADLDMVRLRQEINSTRSRIVVETRRSWQELRNSEGARDVARLDLDVTRERLSVLLAQFEEGRATMRQVEEVRAAEADKWLAFFEAQHVVERAWSDLLRQTGTIMALAK